jgi:hypothetical protein
MVLMQPTVVRIDKVREEEMAMLAMRLSSTK